MALACRDIEAFCAAFFCAFFGDGFGRIDADGVDLVCAEDPRLAFDIDAAPHRRFWPLHRALDLVHQLCGAFFGLDLDVGGLGFRFVADKDAVDLAHGSSPQS